jgi:predicted ABC-type ATPase
VAERTRSPCIYVLAGTNGAGKSSIAAATFREIGVETFDPDAAARSLLRGDPNLTQERANGLAWRIGRNLLERAIADRLSFAFETTLGGATISGLLEQALSSGLEVRVWYAGLASPELHISRVAARVRGGGHDIPEWRIRARYDASRLNLIRLLPKLTELRVYDNSTEGDPAAGVAPRLILVLHTVGGKIVETCELETAPAWGKPILAAALTS